MIMVNAPHGLVAQWFMCWRVVEPIYCERDFNLPPIKILFVGDSITLGLGAGGEPFPTILERELGTISAQEIIVRNGGVNGGVVKSHLRKIEEHLGFNPDVVVIYIGSVDAIPVARRDRMIDLISWLPGRYRQPGWLQPRPYLPTRWWKRHLYAIPESFLRTRFNRLVMALQGTVHVTPLVDFQTGLETLLDAFQTHGAACLMCGLGTIDERKFPGSRQGFERYGAVIRSVAEGRGCAYVDLAAVYGDRRDHRDGLLLLDNFHPNHEGHIAIARALTPHLAQVLEDLTCRRS